MHPDPGDPLDAAMPQAEVERPEGEASPGGSGLSVLPTPGSDPSERKESGPLPGKVSPALDYETDHYRLAVPRIRL